MFFYRSQHLLLSKSTLSYLLCFPCVLYCSHLKCMPSFGFPCFRCFPCVIHISPPLLVCFLLLWLSFALCEPLSPHVIPWEFNTVCKSGYLWTILDVFAACAWLVVDLFQLHISIVLIFLIVGPLVCLRLLCSNKTSCFYCRPAIALQEKKGKRKKEETMQGVNQITHPA